MTLRRRVNSTVRRLSVVIISECAQHNLLLRKFHPSHRLAVPSRELGAVYESSRRKQIETGSSSSEDAYQERFALCRSDHNRYRNRGDFGGTFSGRGS